MARTLLLHALTSPIVTGLWRRWSRGAVPILTLHRFADENRRVPGFGSRTLRRQLGTLRKSGFQVLPLWSALERVEAGEPLERSVVLTVDDGYADFHDVALPIFAEFECPVTVFVVTGFLDGGRWLWWDQVSASLALLGRAGEAPAQIAALKPRPEAERIREIAALVETSGLGADQPPPPRFAPMTWDMVRAAAAQGVTFGPHTVTHPILSQTGASQSEHEIAESWRRLKQETDAAIPVFCYPNGTPVDQGPREFELVRKAGLRAGVTMVPGFVSAKLLADDATRYCLPRFSHPARLPKLLKLTSGLEGLKHSLRNTTGGS